MTSVNFNQTKKQQKQKKLPMVVVKYDANICILQTNRDGLEKLRRKYGNKIASKNMRTHKLEFLI